MKIERDNSLDVLKAISIIFVLIWHLRPLSFILNKNTHIIIFITAKIVRDLELQLCLTAVPLFYIVSLYLFFLKKPDNKYFLFRIRKIFKIFAFWSIFHYIFFLIVTKEVPKLSWEIIIGLKPSLPFVGDSVFYFLFNLICLTTFAFLYQKINSTKLIRMVNYIIIIFCLIFFEASCINNSLIPYHWLINFIIYVPIAYYLVNKPNEILKYKFFYFAAYILFSLHDIYLRTYSYFPSIYGRISIVCGALTIFCFIYSLKIKDSWYIQKLSKYSLGLFAIHKYWQCLILLLISNFEFGIVTEIFGIPINIVFLSAGTLVVIFSVLSIRLLKMTNFKQFIA
ncbi:MAG: acyltransferase family protein [Richelia sp. SM1_7_0]|nr:acyltransferase family protein [Richelia sp. SM1_7_0]